MIRTHYLVEVPRVVQLDLQDLKRKWQCLIIVWTTGSSHHTPSILHLRRRSRSI